MGPIDDPSLTKVVQAAAPAFALGFSFSAQGLIHEDQKLLRVTLRHRGGAEEFSEALAPEEGSRAWNDLTAWLLAGLLGIPVTPGIRTNEPESQNLACLGNGGSVAGPAAAAPAAGVQESSADEWSAPVGMPPVAGDPGLEPLTEEEITTLHTFLAAMAPEARKRFTIEFRHHFQVPREVRTIKDRITQRRHKDFIDAFERELAEVAS